MSRLGLDKDSKLEHACQHEWLDHVFHVLKDKVMWKGCKVLFLWVICSVNVLYAAGTMIYGADKASGFSGASRKPYFIQIGAFSNPHNAHQQFKKIQSKITEAPVKIIERDGLYILRIGPVQDASEVVRIGTRLGTSKQSESFKNQEKFPRAQRTTQNKRALSDYQWFLAAQAGAGTYRSEDQIKVNNGSGFVSPYHEDRYTTRSPTEPVLGLETGFRWQTTDKWLPAYTLGLRYRHFFAGQIGENVVQFSLPEFTNYDYQWELSSNVWMLASKLNLMQYKALMPYVSGGVGISMNQASSYYETAFSGVTPRISPEFSNHTRHNFAYSLGAGLDWEVHSNLVLSLGYEFNDFGRFSSGNGYASWADEVLTLSSVRANSILFGAAVLFDNA